MGTMRGSVGPEHPRAHSDEWVFRSDRRNARGRAGRSPTPCRPTRSKANPWPTSRRARPGAPNQGHPQPKVRAGAHRARTPADPNSPGAVGLPLNRILNDNLPRVSK